MQQTSFNQAGPKQASSNWDRYCPTLVVWPGPPPSLGSNLPDKSPRIYTILGDQAVVVRWIGDHATVHTTNTNDPKRMLRKGPPSEPTDFYPSDCEMRLYPRGIGSHGYYAIKGSSCIYTDADGPHILRPNGGIQGLYPSHSQLSVPTASTQPPTDFSRASEAPLQYHPGLRYALSGGSVSKSVDPRHTLRDPTVKDSGYSGSIRGSTSNEDQRVKYHRPCDHSSNKGTVDAEPWGNFDKGLDDQMVEHAGGQFPGIGNIQWLDDGLEL